MRISTPLLHYRALQSMLVQQQQLSKTQQQIALGRRVNTPADDPVASVHILEMQRALREAEQFGTNADMAYNRLTLEEQALQDIGTLLQVVNERAIQGNSATVDAGSRKLIATELRERLKELMDIANRRDANGEYLFSGYSTKTQPFAVTGTGIGYFGDQHARELQVGPDQRVADSHSGYRVFVAVPEGNGVFAVSAGAGNAGSGTVGAGTVIDRAQWVPDDYTITFIDDEGAYEITDSLGNVVAAGAYTPDSVIVFNGVSINLSGMPAANDTFSVSASATEDVFTTLNKLIAALESEPITEAERAQFHSAMASALQQLQTANDHILGVRAEVGSRLNALETAENAREDLKVELQRMTSELRDLDYAEAISRMNQQLVGLEAAQASYVRISQLSLFDYLR